MKQPEYASVEDIAKICNRYDDCGACPFCKHTKYFTGISGETSCMFKQPPMLWSSVYITEIARACLSSMNEDAVDIVRCRDCKYWRKAESSREVAGCMKGNQNADGGNYYCADGVYAAGSTDYCRENNSDKKGVK